MERLIFHVDVNSAFLSWEAARRVAAGEADLRLIPSAIGGDRDKRTGIILAKSIPAKKFGVTTGEPVGMALRKCPQLVLAPPDFRLYSKNSKAFIAICRRYAPVVEQVSIDECFLDMTGTSLLYPDPAAIAHIIKDTIFSELGFTVNVGIAPNKLLAKMASDFEKPDKVHTLFAHEIPQKLWPLPVGSLFSVGRSTAEKLTAARIRTIGDLAQADLAYIQRLTGVKLGKLIHDYANGIDDAPVLAEPEAVKGYGNSVTLEQDVTTPAQANQILLALCDSVASRMRADSRRCTCVTVTIRGNDFRNRSHQRRLPTVLRTTQESLRTVPQSYREGAFGLGAGKWRVVRTVVLPGCIDGIVTGCILSAGRILGESAALLFTAGFAHTLNKFVIGLASPGATLTVALYAYAKEEGEFDVAFAIAAILMILTLLINLAAGIVGKQIQKRSQQ